MSETTTPSTASSTSTTTSRSADGTTATSRRPPGGRCTGGRRTTAQGRLELHLAWNLAGHRIAVGKKADWSNAGEGHLHGTDRTAQLARSALNTPDTDGRDARSRPSALPVTDRWLRSWSASESLAGLRHVAVQLRIHAEVIERAGDDSQGYVSHP